MLIVFAFYVFRLIILGHLDIVSLIKVFILQSYGLGAYYFWIIVQLYLIFPIVYLLVDKFGVGGGVAVIGLTFLYEILLFFFPIPVPFYRIIALRYMSHLVFGCAVYKSIKKRDSSVPLPLLLICFFIGILYIVFFMMHKEDVSIFRYTSWGNTNVFSCFYIVPLFYVVMRLFKDFRIKNLKFHDFISEIGISSYFILCTQLVWFWFAARIYSNFSCPLILQILVNITFTVLAGILIRRLQRS